MVAQHIDGFLVTNMGSVGFVEIFDSGFDMEAKSAEVEGAPVNPLLFEVDRTEPDFELSVLTLAHEFLDNISGEQLPLPKICASFHRNICNL